MKSAKIAVSVIIAIILITGFILLIIFNDDKPEKKTETEIEKVTVSVQDSKTDTALSNSISLETQTENKEHFYEMNPITVDYIKNLDKKVDMYFLMKMNTLKNATDAKSCLELISLLEQYRECENINFIDIDPNEEPKILSELDPDNSLDLQEGDIVIKCGDHAKRIPASEMYIIDGTYDSNENFTETSKIFQGENLITGAIKAAAENITSTVYFLTGHGEKVLDNEFTAFKKNLKNSNYDVKELDLAPLEAIPDDAAIIISAAPKEDFTDSDKEKLDKYLDNGGNLSLLMSPQSEDAVYKNITDIMREYCLDMNYSRAYEADDSKCLAENKYNIPVQLVKISEKDESLTDLTSRLIDESSSITSYMPPSRTFFSYHGDNYSELNICPLLESSDTAKAETYGTEYDIQNSDLGDSLLLSAYSENPTRNYSKLVVMGNAEFMDDKHIKDGNTIIPLYLYLTTITWMANSDIDVGIPPKEIN